MRVFVVLTDYHSGARVPYENIPRDPVTDDVLDWNRQDGALTKAIRESGAVDGDEVEIIVRRTGRRPFGDRKVRLVESHMYEREK